jgi:2'-5' RNA ligase
MDRLFIAVDIPDPAIQVFADLREEISGFRWTPIHQLHLTLQFLGDTPRSKIGPLEQQLGQIAGTPFSIIPDRLEVFPSIRSARVLVVRLNENAALTDLQRSVVEAVHRAGIEADRRRFKSHVTIARFRHVSAPDLQRYLRSTEPDTRSIEIDRFHLYRSHLAPQGARHERIASFQLGHSPSGNEGSKSPVD